VSPLAPNNCISFVRAGCRRYAMVKQIYLYEGPLGEPEWGVLVSPVHDCFGKDLESPLKTFQWMLYLLCTVVNVFQGNMFFLRPEDITSIAAYRLFPKHMFGLVDGGIIL
ncbi:hypothetical protein CROQUDRAFT_12737, partial [Cronartium quercuum f. sp. fusiforme G11]